MCLGDFFPECVQLLWSASVQTQSSGNGTQVAVVEFRMPQCDCDTAVTTASCMTVRVDGVSHTGLLGDAEVCVPLACGVCTL